MNSNVKLYQVTYNILNLAAAGADNPMFTITEPGRRMSLRSFKLLMKIRETVTQKPMPIEMNTSIEFVALMASGLDQTEPIGTLIKQNNGAGSVFSNLLITKPCILYFENFPWLENWHLSFAMNNKGALNYDVFLTIICEMELFSLTGVPVDIL